MAVFQCRYNEFGFYVGEELRKFNDGYYSTDDKTEIEVLLGLPDVKQVSTVEQPKTEEKTEPAEKPKATKPKPKASAKK